MFCLVKGQEKLGYGKIVLDQGPRWTIEYFDSPLVDGRHVVEAPQRAVARKLLPEQTRVYVQDSRNGSWRIGRVLNDSDHLLSIRFPNKQDEAVDATQTYVRWSRPIEDPAPYLGSFVTETPRFAQARSKFLRTYTQQRAASRGASALCSSSIELTPHQMEVVQRILRDPIQRYLLADEVGLGKTIEAGVLIRQCVSDDPVGHQILVIVPRSLVRQWRQELTRRFGLVDFLDDSVWVIASDDVSELQSHLTRTQMIVVDEAHHLASVAGTACYEVLRAHIHEIERVLLLSATPVLRNEAGFLRMMHLLDPHTFRLNDESGFRKRIQNRQALAEAIAVLEPENALHLDWHLDELSRHLAEDEEVVRRISRLRPHLAKLSDKTNEEFTSELRDLRAHLSETYRLHRRILRNRRRNIKFLTPDRKGVVYWDFSSANARRIEACIEEWRSAANLHKGGEDSVSFYWYVLQALLERPAVLREIVRQRLDGGETFVGESDLLMRLNDLVALPDVSREEALLRNIRSVAGTRRKAVIFCSSTERADSVFERLLSVMPGQVVRHKVSGGDECQKWEAFHSDPSVTALVCDQNAEEGLNLQGGDKIAVHFDSPLSPNRVEQRLGRLDRFGSGSSVVSFVLRDTQGILEGKWASVLADGFGVYRRCIASLQYLIDETMQALRQALFLEGTEAFDDLLGQLEKRVSREIREIDEQDALDSLAAPREEGFDELTALDADWRSIRASTDPWLSEALLFKKRPEPDAGRGGPLASQDPPFRWQYLYGGHGVQTLIPLRAYVESFLGAVDVEAPDSTARTPLTYPYTYHRQTATGRGVRLLRYGDPFIEGTKRFTELDDRGRSFALWRHTRDVVAEEANPSVYFCFDVLIEADMSVAEGLLQEAYGTEAAASKAALRRWADSLLAPTLERVWLDGDGKPVEQSFVTKWLDVPYTNDGATGYSDVNINPARWLALREADFSEIRGWNSRILAARDKALSVLRGHLALNERLVRATSRAQEDESIRNTQRRARSRFVASTTDSDSETEELAAEAAISKALIDGIRRPVFSLDVAGAVFLSTIALKDIVSAPFDERPA